MLPNIIHLEQTKIGLDGCFINYRCKMKSNVNFVVQIIAIVTTLSDCLRRNLHA
jgi:hypothetical protein